MKNFINMIMIAMLSSVIAGCSSEINASLNTEEIKLEKEDKVEAEDNISVQEAGKDKKIRFGLNASHYSRLTQQTGS